MTGYFCATPYHIMAAMTMACGEEKPDNILVILDHFKIDEALVKRIRETDVFGEVVLYHSNNKTRLSRAKRLVNTFIPDKLMRRLMYQTACEKWVFFALDFINLTHVIAAYEKRGIACEFAYGEDGSGAYVYKNCYVPSALPAKLMKLNGHGKYLDRVKNLYVYKPAYMVENTHFCAKEIPQSAEISAKLKEAVCHVWPLEEEASLISGILYFEQPYAKEICEGNIATEQKCLGLAAEILDADIMVKMHPRSQNQYLWADYEIMRTTIPFEAVLLQSKALPKLIMANNSTALFSAYLLDGLVGEACPSMFLSNLMPVKVAGVSAAAEKFCALINENCEDAGLLFPKTQEEFQSMLRHLADVAAE